MPNRLICEDSPYLQQHAHNPVDWYPWGEEALRRAQEEDKPILLSVGYSACHWCHVMERESFEDTRIASTMNERFVNIKVDREERPDIDSIYMQAVQAVSGHGGWPMTVFLTPDLKPFFGGTYYPPEDRSGMPGFPRVLEAVSEAYRTNRQQITEAAERLTGFLRSDGVSFSDDPLDAKVLRMAFENLSSSFDAKHGGLGGHPKFPQPMTWEFALRYYYRTGEKLPLDMAELTACNMARGGIYDHIGGGFHRYSVDERWLVPHFEKMLYDNALLVRLYLHLYQATGHYFYARVAQETLDYVLREMTGPEGGFYSSQDADSDGEEGSYYVWTSEEIDQAVGKEYGELLKHYWGVREPGNFNGKNILWVERSPEEVAEENGMGTDAFLEILRWGRSRLFEERCKRVPPVRDEKILTSWNAMVIQSLTEASVVLGRSDYLRAAERNASLLLDKLRVGGRLFRAYRGGKPKIRGYLEDYAFLADALLTLYGVTFHRLWLEEAKSLTLSMVDLFWDSSQGIFYDTGTDHECLLLRPRDIYDNATPCGNSVATEVLLRLGLLLGDSLYPQRAIDNLSSVQVYLQRYPFGFSQWLAALDFLVSTPQEVVIVGPRGAQDTDALLSVVFGRYLPNKVVVGWDPGDPEANAQVPLLRGRDMISSKPTAFVCENYTCLLPTTDPAELNRQLSDR